VRTAFPTYSGSGGIHSLPRTRNGPASTPAVSARTPPSLRRSSNRLRSEALVLVAALVCHEFVNRQDGPCRANLGRPRRASRRSGEELIPNVTQVRQGRFAKEAVELPTTVPRELSSGSLINGNVLIQCLRCAAFQSTVPTTCGRPGHSCTRASGFPA